MVKAIIEKEDDSMLIFYDNMRTIVLAKDYPLSKKNEPDRRRYHFLRGEILKGVVQVKHVRIEANIANALTKSVKI